MRVGYWLLVITQRNMRTWITRYRSLAALGLLCAVAAPAPAEAKPDTTDARAAFDKLKSLAGEWRGTLKEKGSGEEGMVVYRVTANGTAVVETIFPGTPHEMITVYHLDGDRLMLTHYCAAGNQPRMTLTRKSTPQQLDFNFAGGTSLRSSKDPHMHALRIRFETRDQIAIEWDFYENGKLKECEKFFLSRKS